ncbi:hypothetical protein BGI41_06375 [Methanobrevibacter sp. 87.7]|nr:hypothetical protein BGI41_06375 [Methanobrevibacter sp. 87.7]
MKKLKIITNENIINIEVKIYKSFLERFKGLMLKDKINYPLIFIIPENYLLKTGIHTLFMKIPIDILFIDKENRIYDTCSLKPWHFYTPKKEAKYIIELEYGFINKNKVEIDNKIIISDL